MTGSCGFRHQTWTCTEMALANQDRCLLHTPPFVGEPDRKAALAAHLAKPHPHFRDSYIHGMYVVDLEPVWPILRKQDVHGHGVTVLRAVEASGFVTDKRLAFENSHFPAVSLKHCRFGMLQFSASEFERSLRLDRVHVTGIMSFGGSKFLDSVTGPYIENLEAETLIADGCDIEGSFVLRKSRIGKLTMLNRSVVHRTFECSENTLGSKATFYNMEIHGTTKFEKLELGKTVVFSLSTFHGLTSIGGLSLKGANLAFDQTKFRGDVFLQEWIFDPESHASFEKCQFLQGATIENWDFHAESPKIQVVMSNVPIGETARIWIRGKPRKDGTVQPFTMRGFSFLHTDASRIRFTNVSWSMPAAWLSRRQRACAALVGIVGRKVKFLQNRAADEDNLERKPGQPTSSGSASWIAEPAALADLYRDLRLSYEAHAAHSEAGGFHVREMEMRRLAIAADSGLSTRRKVAESVVSGLYREFSWYGESYLRPLAWLGASIIGIWTVETHQPPFLDVLGKVLPGRVGLVTALDAFIPGTVSSLTTAALVVLGTLNLALAVVALRRHFMRR